MNICRQSPWRLNVIPLNQKIGYINLTSGDIKVKSIPWASRKKSIHARGMESYLFDRQIPEGDVDPLGPDNMLVLSRGVSTNPSSSFAAHMHVAAVSPLTGLQGFAEIGGVFAAELAWAGIQHMTVFGQSDRPVYLFVHNAKIEIRDASELWGKSTTETLWAIREKHCDDEVKCLVIGPAGENLVRYASIMAGINNAGGHIGMGCVMGSKCLKAIAIRGTMDVRVAPWADPCKKPSQVFTDCIDEDDENTTRREFFLEPTYTSAMSRLSSNHLVDQYGVDGLKIGSMISWAMGMYKLGVFTKEQTDGLDLCYGNDDAILEMIHRICTRKGWLGDTLADRDIPASEMNRP